MLLGTSISSFFRTTVVSFVAVVLLSASAISMARPAAADPALSIWSIPTISYIGDGMNQVIGVKAILETGNFVDIIRVIVDEGTLVEKVYEFEANGDETSTDAGFVDVFCSATFFSDGYALGESVINCKLVLDKSAFAAGLHPTKVELVLDIGTFSDTSKFRLLSSPTSLSDLVNKSFSAPSTAGRGDIKSTYTKEKNEGNRDARGHWVKIYLSSDTTLDVGDKVVGKRFVSFLGEGKTKTLLIEATIPGNYPLGPENFISMLDTDNRVGEQDETNNDRTKATTITT
ncbi:MAG: hypothetical protein MN733_13045 [Nitrososphaera sp.]|nr:hypothetical protein [Nitrososphaera sp.]